MIRILKAIELHHVLRLFTSMFCFGMIMSVVYDHILKMNLFQWMGLIGFLGFLLVLIWMIET